MLLGGLEGELTTAAGQFAGDANQERPHGLHFPTPQLLVAAPQRHPADQVVGQDRALEQRGVGPRPCDTVSLHNSRNLNRFCTNRITGSSPAYDVSPWSVVSSFTFRGDTRHLLRLDSLMEKVNSFLLKPVFRTRRAEVALLAKSAELHQLHAE